MTPEPLKQCQCCSARAPVAAITCVACGEGTWLALGLAEPTSALPPDPPSGDLPSVPSEATTANASPQAKRKK